MNYHNSIWYRLKYSIWKLRYRSGLTNIASQNIDDWSCIASLAPSCQRQALHTDADPDMVTRPQLFANHFVNDSELVSVIIVVVST